MKSKVQKKIVKRFKLIEPKIIRFIKFLGKNPGIFLHRFFSVIFWSVSGDQPPEASHQGAHRVSRRGKWL
jgi:hypothetical protein